MSLRRTSAARHARCADLEVWERGADMVVASHRSRLSGYTAETLEAVRFERPDRITFRHLRGPSRTPTESFELVDHDDGTASCTAARWESTTGRSARRPPGSGSFHLGACCATVP